MLDDPDVTEALTMIFPLLPWALDQAQQGIDPLRFSDLEPGTKAAMVHNFVMKEGERRFADLDGIDVVNSQGLLHFALRRVLLRVKHAKPKSLRIATNQTIQTAEWTYQLPLEGIADPRNRLHLVYVPDPLWTRVVRSVVAVYHGDEAKDWRDVDVDAWYNESDGIVSPFVPGMQIPPLRLKPGVIPQPLEGFDGTS